MIRLVRGDEILGLFAGRPVAVLRGSGEALGVDVSPGGRVCEGELVRSDANDRSVLVMKPLDAMR